MSHEASPHWSEWAWLRNTYLRFLLRNTADEMHTVAHQNFFAASTLADRGTQWAEE